MTYLLICGSAFIAILVSPVGRASNLRLVSRAPKGGAAIATFQDADRKEFVFVDTATSERLGYVVPPDLHGTRINGVACSWSADGAKVAVLVSYGTKLSALLVYSRDRKGKMLLIDLPDIDPIDVYTKRDGTKYPRQAPGFDENAVGRWLTNDTVKLVRGDAKERENGTVHFLVVLDVKVEGNRGNIVKVLPTGVLSDSQAEQFFRQEKWQYQPSGGR